MNFRLEVLVAAFVCGATLTSCVNTAPIIEPLIVTQDGHRARIVPAGSTVQIETLISDREHDATRLSWYANDGRLLSNGLPATSWKLSTLSGTHTILLTATDEHGAQSVAQAQVTVGDHFAYEATVLTPDGKPLGGATVTVNGVSTLTAADGSFRLLLPPGAVNRDRFSIDIRKAGVMSLSQLTTSPPSQSQWLLGSAWTVQRNTNAQINVADSGNDCRAPFSSRINWALYPELSQPKTLNSSGAYVDASLQHPLADALRYILSGADCNYGANLSISANSIVDPATGNQPAVVDVSIGTVDLNAPNSMPGNRSVEGTDYMESMGAAEITITANGKPMQLTDGANAVLSVPVPRRLRCRDEKGGLYCPPVPAEISLLVYDSASGQWQEDGAAYYDRETQSYVAKLTHLSAFNMDILKINPGCLRVDSQAIGGQFALDVIIPNSPNVDPTYVHREVPNPPGDQLHAFFNLPPDTDVGIVAMRKQADPGCPTQQEISPIGVFVGTTGSPVPGGFPRTGPPAPYGQCGPTTVLSDLSNAVQIVRDGAGIAVGTHSAVFYALADPVTDELLPLDGSNTCSFHAGGSTACSAIGILDPGSVLMRMQIDSPNRLTGNAYGQVESQLFGITDNQVVDVRLNDLSSRVSGVIPEDPPGGANPARIQVDDVRIDVPVPDPNKPLELTLIGTWLIQELVYHVDYKNVITNVPEITGVSQVARVTLYGPGDAAIPQGEIDLVTAVYAPGIQPAKYILRDLEFVNGCSTVSGQPGPNPDFQFQFDPGSSVTAINDGLAAALGLQKDGGGNHTGAHNCFDTPPANDKKGYQLNRFVVAGENGSYRIDNPVVCWNPESISSSAFGRPIDALLGSNLFNDVEIVVDGTTGKVGIIQ